MRKKINLTLDEELIEQAKTLGINISDLVNTMLKTYLQGIPARVIKQYAKLNAEQRKWTEKKLLKITKDLFEPEAK